MRCPVTTSELLAISLLTPNDPLYDKIKDSWSTDVSLQLLITKLLNWPFKFFTWCHGQLRWKGRLVVGADQELRKTIIELWHSSSQGGHSGMDTTIKRLQSLFYWKFLARDVKKFINK